MSDASSWWARKLGQAPEVPVGQHSYAPTGYAPGYVPAPAQVVPQPAWAGPEVNEAPFIEDPTVPGGKRLNWRSPGFLKGGQGNREETQRCPQCNSTNYFSLRQNSKVTQNGHVPPAPQCFNCSYNGGLFTIFGGN